MLTNARVLTGFLLLLSVLVYLLLVLPSSVSYADVFLNSGNADTCNEVHVALVESPVCPRPPPNNAGVNNYTVTIKLRSLDGKAHSVHYWDHNDFCVDGMSNNLPNCADNPINGDAYINLDAAGDTKNIVVTRSPTIGSACGSYQIDFGIGDVDGSKSCHYETSGGAGASGRCLTGITCQAATWQGNATSVSACQSGKAVLQYTFQNLQSFPVDTITQDNESGVQKDLGIVNPNKTVSGTLNTGQTSLSGTQQEKFDEWQNGVLIGNHAVAYNPINCQPPTATPTPTPTPIPTYTISGNVFNDTNKDKLLDNGEQNYSGGATITSSTGSITVNPDGSYLSSGLLAGTYTISYTSSLPSGYNFIWPKNGSPPSFLVTVGGACNVPDTSTGGGCDGAGNVINLNFAISNSTPWIQTYNLDLRNDNGFSDQIPSTSVCTANASVNNTQATNPGIIYSGDGSYDFGQGQASTNHWVVGGAVYPETFSQSSGSLRTSYASLYALAQHANLPITDMGTLSGCATPSNCTLPPALPNGIYQAQGSVTLNTYSFPSNTNYVFLINGDLTIAGNLTVPVGSTALFSAGGNIFVNKGVKAAADACPPPAGQIQGEFIAGQNFTVRGINDCTVGKDNMLNIDGSVVVNANGIGGTFINHRDLCNNNLSYPAVSINPRLDFVLNAPSFLTQRNTVSMEEAP